MQFVLEELDYRKQQVSQKPCHKEWNKHTAQIADGDNGSSHTQKYEEATYKTIKCYFFFKHVFNGKSD